MTDKMTYNESLKLFRKQFKRWKYIIEHYGWQLTTRYYECSDDMPQESDEWIAAYTVVDFKYLEATIHINVKRCQDFDEKQIEYIVVHELVHLLVSPLQESSEVTPLEYTVTSIARIMQGLRSK